MEKGIALQGYIPMRIEPSDTSEMVSQVLFGEEFRILDKNGKWQLLSLDFDGFEGWVRQDSFYAFNPENEADMKPIRGVTMVSDPSFTIRSHKQSAQVILPAGSVLPEMDGKNVSLKGFEYEIPTREGLITPGPGIDPERIGAGLISVPYIWGGRSGFGFDSPGLVQMLCRMMGITIPRLCDLQAKLGINVNFLHETNKGDLAFFDNEEGDLIHVGMVLDKGRILHSSANVRIDNLDQQGIYNCEKEAYTHKLRLIKRVRT